MPPESLKGESSGVSVFRINMTSSSSTKAINVMKDLCLNLAILHSLAEILHSSLLEEQLETLHTMTFKAKGNKEYKCYPKIKNTFETVL